MNFNKIINRYDDFINNTKRHTAIQLVDNERMVIENCKGVSVFNENQIVLRLSKCVIKIVGLNLRMKNFNQMGVEISGRFHSIGFDDAEGKE